MRNRIVNITATGGWEEITGVPHQCLAVSIQARTSVDVLYRFVQRTGEAAPGYWTIKADTLRTLTGHFDQGDIQIQAAADTVVEVEYSTMGAII